LKEYEKMASFWSEKAKVDYLGQYLEGAATGWRAILENELKEELTYDDQGRKSNRWLDLKWTQLRRQFQKEYLTASTRVIGMSSRAGWERSHVLLSCVQDAFE
jgi:hypothetical protein